MNQQDALPGAPTATANAAASPRGTSADPRLNCRPITAGRGEAGANRAARLAWTLWALSLPLLIGYIPLRYLLHVAATAPGTHTLVALTDTVPNVIVDVFGLAGYLTYSTLGALIVS